MNSSTNTNESKSPLQSQPRSIGGVGGKAKYNTNLTGLPFSGKGMLDGITAMMTEMAAAREAERKNFENWFNKLLAGCSFQRVIEKIKTSGLPKQCFCGAETYDLFSAALNPNITVMLNRSMPPLTVVFYWGNEIIPARIAQEPRNSGTN